MDNTERKKFHETFYNRDGGFPADLSEALPKSICKFYGNKGYAIEAVKNDILYLSRPDAFNDPFDSALNLDYLAIIKEREIQNGIRYKKNAKKEYIETMEVLDSKIKQELFIGCLGEEKCVFSNLMWANYAHNHEGFCVEYNFITAFDLLQKEGYVLWPVYYTDTYRVPIIFEEEDKFKYYLSAFCTKALCWEGEFEWRIIKSIDTGAARYSAKIGIPESIYIGCRAGDYLKKRLKKICAGKHIKLYQMEIAKNSYKLSGKLICDNAPCR